MNQQLTTALEAYGLAPTSIQPVSQKTCYAACFDVLCDTTRHIARVRHPMATEADVRLSRTWAPAVSTKVPVPPWPARGGN